MIPFPEDRHRFALAVSEEDFPNFIRDYFRCDNTFRYFIDPQLTTPASILVPDESKIEFNGGSWETHFFRDDSVVYFDFLKSKVAGKTMWRVQMWCHDSDGPLRITLSTLILKYQYFKPIDQSIFFD